MSLVVKNMDDLEQLDESELEELYSWVDKIPLSRPKRNISRDFSDGVLVAEVVKHFLPKHVDLHNYTPGSATPQKMQNWFLMNRKVFAKLNFQLTEDLIRELCLGKAGLIERFLMHLRAKIEKAMWDMQKDAGERKDIAEKVNKSSQRMHTNSRGLKPNFNDKPEADQDLISPGRQKQPSVPSVLRGNIKSKSFEETVPRAVYEEKEQECLSKEETIQILQAKVRRLEHLLHLKDIRIEDLQNKLEAGRPTGKGIR